MNSEALALPICMSMSNQSEKAETVVVLENILSNDDSV
jgi:hypothetical protein